MRAVADKTRSSFLTRSTVPGVAFLVVLDILVQVFQILGPAALNRFQNGGDPAAALRFLALRHGARFIEMGG